MKIKRSIFLCVTLLLVSLLCACGGSGGSSSETTDDDNANPPASELRVIEYSGNGTTLTDSFEVTNTENIVFDYTFTGEDNSIAWLKDNQGNNVELIVNEIGSTSGQKDVQLAPGVYHLSINAENNSWNISVSGYSIERVGGSTTPVNPEADAVEINTNLEAGIPLSHGGQFTLDAYVTYTITTDTGTEIRRPIPDGTLVNFSIEQGGGNITNAKITKDGLASATFQGGTYGGLVTIKASVSENVFDTFSFEVAPDDIGSISIKNIVPENKVINVIGTGQTNVANIQFEVTDAFGNLAEDGRTVFFDIANPLNGGEQLSTTETNTLNGLVSVAVKSGTVPGPLSVRATYPSNDGTSISTEAQITIVSGRADAEHISMAAEHLNIAGGVEFGLQDTITTYLGDRYGNVPDEETQVSFITEGGTIGESTGFTTTTTYGVAQAVLQTSAPTTPNLDGNDSNANPGWCRIVTYTRGSESFNDINGNGVYDEGIDEISFDMSDPYIDSNDNGQWDTNEKYIDANGDEVFTPADGVYQSDTTIWTSMNVLFSDYAAPLNLTPTSFDLKIGECQTFTCNVSDIYGNALVSGTTLSVEASAGNIIGLEDFTQADTPGPGFTFSFALCSELDPGAEAEMSQVTVSLTPAGEATSAPGNNGAELIQLASGTINQPNPTPEPPTPNVVFTLPNDEAVDVPVDQNVLLVFSEAMEETTFTGGNIYIEKLVEGGNNIYYPVDVKFNSNDTSQVELAHRDDNTFENETTYLVTLKDDLESAEGQNIEYEVQFNFTTAPE